jgi:hypothetical protein
MAKLWLVQGEDSETTRKAEGGTGNVKLLEHEFFISGSEKGWI